MPTASEKKSWSAMFKLIGKGLLVVMLVSSCYQTVGTGKRGIRVQFGQVMGEPLPEGFYFKIPFVQRINEVNVRTQAMPGETSCYTKDIQTAKLQYTVYFNLDPKNAGQMYRDVGRDWEVQYVPQAVQGEMKTVIGKWDAVDLIANRDKATQDILAALQESMATKNIQVTRLEITNIDYNPEFEKAVEAKVIAVQEASKAQNQTRKIEEEAKQRIISAKAEAESMKIRSEALSQNQNLVAYEAVQKWDGKMPQYMLGGSTMPFINLNNK